MSCSKAEHGTICFLAIFDNLISFFKNFALQKKWNVSKWNASLGWNGLIGTINVNFFFFFFDFFWFFLFCFVGGWGGVGWGSAVSPTHCYCFCFFLKIEKLPRRKFWIISIFLIRNIMSFATNVQEPWS